MRQIMGFVDLFDASRTPPTSPHRRRLTAAVGVLVFLISVPVVTIAAVAGFVRGWQGAPRDIQGDNIIEPFLFLGWALAGAAFYALIAVGAIASVAVLAVVVGHRRRRAGRL